MTTKDWQAERDKAAQAERIYEPKYGGKDHSGYDTLMKYEVNDEREDCFARGFDAGRAQVLRELAVVRKALLNIEAHLETGCVEQSPESTLNDEVDEALAVLDRLEEK